MKTAQKSAIRIDNVFFQVYKYIAKVVFFYHLLCYIERHCKAFTYWLLTFVIKFLNTLSLTYSLIIQRCVTRE